MSVSGYSSVDMETRVHQCAALGRGHACQGLGLYRTVLMYVLLALTHAWIRISAGEQVSMYVACSV